MTKLRIFLFAVFLILVAILIVFPFRSKTPIKIAFMGSLSGNGSTTDIAACNGAVMAVNAVNIKGGVKGRQIELSLYDFKGKPDNVTHACLAMSQKKTSLLIAPFICKDTLDVCGKSGQILIVSAGSSSWGEKTDDPQLNLHFRVQGYAIALADLVLSRGTQTLTVIYDPDYFPHGQAFLSGFTNRYIGRGGRILAELALAHTNHEACYGISDSLGKLAPEGLLVIASPRKTGRLSARARKKIPQIKLYGAPWAMTEELAATGLELINGMTGYLSPPSVTRQSASLKAFFENYQNSYKNPATLSALLGYEAVLILTEGIRNSASPDPLLIKHTLLKLNQFKGMICGYDFIPQGRRRPVLVLGQVRDGKLIRENKP